MAVEVVNGTLEVGDRIAYPGAGRQVTATVHRIVESRHLLWVSGGRNEVKSEVRITVREVEPRWPASEPRRVLRNPLNIVILRLANDGEDI